MEKLSIIFISGPLSGKKYSLEKPETILGNSKDCDIFLESEQISSDYMSIYVGLRNTTLVIKSSDFSAVLNNELITQPKIISDGDVFFLPDGTIGYFQSEAENISVNFDTNNHAIAITGNGFQHFFQIPLFSVEYFCWVGYEKLYKEEYQAAEEYFNEAKKYNPYYAQIYRGLLFIDMQISSEEQILFWNESIEENSNYKYFMEYARIDEKMGLINKKKMLIYENNQTLYDEAMRIISVSSDPIDFEGAIRRLEKIPDFRDSNQISERCKNESDTRRIQKTKWYTNIDNEQKKQGKKSGSAKTYLFFSFILLIIGCILLVNKINSSKDEEFISTVLAADNSNLDAVTQMVSEKYEKSPNKYLELLQKAFTQAYLENNFSQMDTITNICLNSTSIATKFSDYLAFEYRDYAIDYLTSQLQDFVEKYKTGTKKSTASIRILDSYPLISEVSLKIVMELLNRGELEKALALMDLLDDDYDMTPIINSTIRPMFISTTINTKNGYYDNSKNKFKDSSYKNSIGWTESTTTYYHGDLACRKTRVYDPDIHWEGDPSYKWYYKGDYISGTSCSNLDYILEKYTTYTFGSYNVEISSSSYAFKNNETGESITLKIK